MGMQAAIVHDERVPLKNNSLWKSGISRLAYGREQPPFSGMASRFRESLFLPPQRYGKRNASPLVAALVMKLFALSG